MKRRNNLYEQICSIQNLQLADSIARKGKAKQPGVIKHDGNRDANIMALRIALTEKTYKPTGYRVFKIREPKERIIHCTDYYPGRILDHAIMNILEPTFTSMFTADTYGNIKGRGNHGASRGVKRALKDIAGTQYCLKLDIRKFYPSVDHEVLKQILRRKFKDQDLLNLLDKVIDSADGLPIGNYISQYFANLYLTPFDHWLKEKMRVKYYFRYVDDMVILSGSKEFLHQILAEIKTYLLTQLKLELKDNYQVFPVDDRGIDFVGFVFFHKYTLIRKRIKQNCARMLATNRNPKSLVAYYGWFKHSNSRNLQKKLSITI